ncbi:MAG: hypothetical protein E6G29_12000 [Actinobacteria bacterium]|nr:MAG: hypothetical protein E6G29_12000 [Actinomycetota bacterium]
MVAATTTFAATRATTSRTAAPSGNDHLIGGKGRDVLKGGPGNDTIDARDGQVDTINCGSGDDQVKADRKDHVAHNCEHVKRS